MSTLIIIDNPPYGSWEGREALDMALSMAAFDQPVSLLFCGAGVNWLRSGQSTTGVEQKSVEKNLAAAPIFGVERIMADISAREQFRLDSNNLLDQVEWVELNDKLTNQFAQVAFAG